MTTPHAIARRHIEAWLEAEPPASVSLIEHVEAAIREGMARRDDLWRDGNSTLRHERDLARDELARRVAQERSAA